MESGKFLATYSIQNSGKAITCVDYHPYDHVLAFCAYGAPVSAQVLKYDRESDGNRVGLKLLTMSTGIVSVNSSARLKLEPIIVRNGGKHLQEKFSARSFISSNGLSQNGTVSHGSDDKVDEEVRRRLKGKLQNFIESGPNIRAKSLSRLNGIIEKIDRILMYATTQKSPAVDVESARQATIFTISEKNSFDKSEMFELKDFSQQYEEQVETKPTKHRQRSKSARNACSPIPQEMEYVKAFSDSAAFNHKISRFSDDSSNSNRSIVQGNFVIEKLELEKMENMYKESGYKDSLDTIIDGKEDFPSEEVLDIESLKSDDTYVVSKDKDSSLGDNDDSEKSNATFVIESEVPVPKPRKRVGRIEVL